MEDDSAMLARMWDEAGGSPADPGASWDGIGAGCVFVSRETGRLLLARQGEDTMDPLTWGTWDSASVPGETPQATALREASRIAGHVINDDSASPLGEMACPDGGMPRQVFLVAVQDEFPPSLDWRTAEAAWVAYGEWPRPLSPALGDLLGRKESRVAHGAVLDGGGQMPGAFAP